MSYAATKGPLALFFVAINVASAFSDNSSTSADQNPSFSIAHSNISGALATMSSELSTSDPSFAWPLTTLPLLSQTTTLYRKSCANPRAIYKIAPTYPDWFVQNFLFRWGELACEQPVVLVLANYTTQLLDTRSGLPVERYRMCRVVLMQRLYAVALDFFFVFLDISPNLSRPAPKLDVLADLLAFLFYPLALVQLVYSLRIIRQFLRQNGDSNVFISHAAIVLVDHSLYLVTALKGVQMLDILFLPLCFCGSIFIESQPEAVTITMHNVIVEALFGTAGWLQAALAADRAAAMLWPAWYHAKMLRRHIVVTVLVIFASHAMLFLFDLCAQAFVLAAALNTFYRDPRFIVTYDTMTRVSSGVRAVVYLFSWCVQFVAYALILRKVAKPTPVHQVNPQSSGARTSCVLLLGTSILNFVGGAFHCASLVVKIYVNVVANGNYYNSPANKVLNAAVAARLVAIAVSSMGTTWVHVLASSEYRRIASQTLPGKALSFVLAQCMRRTRRRGVQPLSSTTEATSAGESSRAETV